MNFIQKLFMKAAVRTGAFRFAPEWVRAVFLPVTLRRLLDGYHKNSAVAACVTTLAFSFPEAPLLVGYETPDGRFVADYKHKALGLIRQPNPDMGEGELMQFIITYAAIGGNLYLWKQRGQNGRVIALWPFSDVNIMPVPGQSTADGFVKEYEFDAGEGQPVSIPKSEIIHWKWMPDPEQPARGIGAIEFAIRDSDRDSEANAYIYALLKNNAVPPVVVTMAEGDELTEKKAKRLRKQWNQRMGGENRGNLAFLEYGMKAEKLGFDLQQLAGEALNAVPEARIAAAFRVPPVVAGLSVGLKRSDYGDQAARRAFTELTLSALWRSLASELWNALKDEFPGTPENYTMRFDLRQVRALQEEESKRWERATLAFNRSVLTRAETKQELGIEPGRGDDVYFVSLASEFIPADREEVIREPLKGLEMKARGDAIGRQLQRVRLTVAKRMETAVDVFFTQFARALEERLKGKKKKLPNAEDLLQAADNLKMTAIVKRFYIEVLELSWNAWNVALGVELAFDLDDPIVTGLLAEAGKHVEGIQKTTLEELRQALQYGSEQGWGIDQIVRGDPENGVRGLRQIVEETYKGRARTIARSELGDAQNAATAQRYQRAGVDQVLIMDDGAGDEDEPCVLANGQIWTVDYFNNNRLEHPNCTRAAAPYFGDAEPNRS
jgi:HK97 family phage portal protein